MPPKGDLAGGHVLVRDEREGNTLHNKGSFGVPQSGGSLKLDLAEALYLVENGRLAIEGHDAASLLRHASATESGFEIRYIVYRDLRGRTFAVKSSNVSDFNLFPRGSLPGKTPSHALVRCASERGSLDAEALAADIAKATKHGKQLLVALVDEEGDLTYYEAQLAQLQSDITPLPKRSVEATLLEDRVMVLDAPSAKSLFGDGYFGRDVGLGLQLSLPEAIYLARRDRLVVRDTSGAQVSVESLAERARRLEPEFDLRESLYAHLRREGVVVKTGFKYGTHFRAYTGPPDEEHAPYLVHALDAGRRVPWPEVSGFVRLAHGVRKRLFFALRQGDGFQLLELARKKP